MSTVATDDRRAAKGLPNLLTSEDVAALFSTTVENVYIWRRNGALPPAIKLGKRFYWNAQAVARFVEERTGAGAASA